MAIDARLDHRIFGIGGSLTLGTLTVGSLTDGSLNFGSSTGDAVPLAASGSVWSNDPKTEVTDGDADDDGADTRTTGAAAGTDGDSARGAAGGALAGASLSRVLTHVRSARAAAAIFARRSASVSSPKLRLSGCTALLVPAGDLSSVHGQSRELESL